VASAESIEPVVVQGTASGARLHRSNGPSQHLLDHGERLNRDENPRSQSIMKPNLRRLAIVFTIFMAAALVVPTVASAQMREFSGRIDRVSKKKMIVDNRMGDKVSFVPAEAVEVTGEEKTEWKQLKKGDWVTVSWKFIDKPRKAYKVTVRPPKEDDDE